jgi:hypothetical protein
VQGKGPLICSCLGKSPGQPAAATRQAWLGDNVPWTARGTQTGLCAPAPAPFRGTGVGTGVLQVDREPGDAAGLPIGLAVKRLATSLGASSRVGRHPLWQGRIEGWNLLRSFVRRRAVPSEQSHAQAANVPLDPRAQPTQDPNIHENDASRLRGGSWQTGQIGCRSRSVPTHL